MITVHEAAELLKTSVAAVEDLMIRHRISLQPVKAGSSRCIRMSDIQRAYETESR
jgi:excisionase family DNA binding protein